MHSVGKHKIVTLHNMSQLKSTEVVQSGGGSATDLRGSAEDLRSSSEKLGEVVMSDSTGTVGLIFIEQKDGIVVLMCGSLSSHADSISSYLLPNFFPLYDSCFFSFAGVFIRAAPKKMGE